jgi:acyl-CoA synthetase (AMP-forming)/AMP-acid ligase II
VLLREYVVRNASSWPNRPAFVSESRRLTWAEVAERAARLAGALRALGVGHGDVVCCMSSDSHEVVEHWYATAMLGAVRTGVHHRYSARELGHILRNSRAKVLILQGGKPEDTLARLDEMPPDLQYVVGFGDHAQALDYETLLGDAKPITAEDWGALEGADRACIGYTSGSTGLPKGALSTADSVLSASLNTWCQAGLLHDDVILNGISCLGGANILFTAGNVLNGATSVLLGRFTAEEFIRTVEREGVTVALLVPTMLQDVLNHPTFSRSALRSLRMVIYGAAPATPSLVRRAMDELDCELQQWYGSTEATGGWTTILHHNDHVRALAEAPEILESVGRATVHTEIRIVDDEGQEVPRGSVGTIAVRSETLMQCYVDAPDETAEILRDGWLEIGDLGYLDDDGYLFIGDRKHFKIVTGGFNVYPLTVENALAEHDALSEVCVFGLPDERLGEIVCAVVVAKRPVDAAELIEFCRQRMASYAVPRRIEFADSLPRGANDKVLKQEVRRGYLEPDAV